MVLGDVAICLAGIVGSFAAFIFPFYRKRTTKLLRTINEINRDVLKRNHNALENRRASNRLFKIISILFGVLQGSGTMTVVLFAWEFANTGLPQFNSFLYQPTPYSVVAFVDEILFLIPALWMESFITLYFSMYIEFILRISFHFRVLAEDMRNLRRGVESAEDKELQKLKALIKDLNFYYW